MAALQHRVSPRWCNVPAASAAQKRGGARDSWTRGECFGVFVFPETKHTVTRSYTKPPVYTGISHATFLHHVITFYFHVYIQELFKWNLIPVLLKHKLCNTMDMLEQPATVWHRSHGSIRKINPMRTFMPNAKYSCDTSILLLGESVLTCSRSSTSVHTLPSVHCNMLDHPHNQRSWSDKYFKVM